VTTHAGFVRSAVDPAATFFVTIAIDAASTHLVTNVLDVPARGVRPSPA